MHWTVLGIKDVVIGKKDVVPDSMEDVPLCIS